jgi:hypothetical protein
MLHNLICASSNQIFFTDRITDGFNVTAIHPEIQSGNPYIQDRLSDRRDHLIVTAFEGFSIILL